MRSRSSRGKTALGRAAECACCCTGGRRAWPMGRSAARRTRRAPPRGHSGHEHNRPGIQYPYSGAGAFARRPDALVPVSGSVPHAEAMALTIMVGGDAGRPPARRARAPDARPLSASAIGSPMLRARIPLVFDRPEHARCDVELMPKDVGLALRVRAASRRPAAVRSDREPRAQRGTSVRLRPARHGRPARGPRPPRRHAGSVERRGSRLIGTTMRTRAGTSGLLTWDVRRDARAAAELRGLIENTGGLP